MRVIFESEAALTAHCAECARAWRAAKIAPLVIGLDGDLGSGKTTWVRGLLRGLGYAGTVPSPTYTLLEDYVCDALTVSHLDLYRLADAGDLEYLGLRDRLGEADSWVLIEWPERAPRLADLCDLRIRFEFLGPEGRALSFEGRTERGRSAAAALSHF